MMLKLKLQYFGHLMWRVDSLENTLMLGGIGGRRRRDDPRGAGWMASRTRWTWVWVKSGWWWWAGRPGMLRFMGSQRVGHDWATELNWTELKFIKACLFLSYLQHLCVLLWLLSIITYVPSVMPLIMPSVLSILHSCECNCVTIWRGTVERSLWSVSQSVQLLSHFQLFAAPWTAACQASLSITNSWSLLKVMAITLVMPSNNSSSVVPFSSCLQSFPASRSFPMSQFFASGGQL